MYAKVFDDIFDSSIANNYELRHFFMDLLVLADCNGVVDKTAEAIAARTRIPFKKVVAMIAELEKPDPESRNADHDGRRISRLDTHRTWGWYIVNYGYYRDIARESERRETARASMERHRTKAKNSQLLENQAGNGALAKVDPPHIVIGASVGAVLEGGRGRFQRPELDVVKQRAAAIGLPPEEAEKFFDYYESNGWRVGKNPMKLWTAALANWKRHWIEYDNPKTNNQRPAAGYASDTF